MEPKNKEEALKMIEQLNAYIENVGDDAWTEDDIYDLNANSFYGYASGALREFYLCCDADSSAQIMYSIMDHRHILIDGYKWLDDTAMADYLNKNGYKKHKGE